MAISSLIIVVAEENILTTGGIKTNFDKSTNLTSYSFTTSQDSITVNGHTYSNINPGGKLVFDSNGTITNAQFTTGNQSNNKYFFGNQLVPIPSNSKVDFNKNNLDIYAQSGSRIAIPSEKTTSKSNTKDAIISYNGQNLEIEGAKVDGKLIYENGKFSVSDVHKGLGGRLWPSSLNSTSSTTINGVGLSKGDVATKVPIFIGNVKQENDGIYFLNKNEIVVKQTNTKGAYNYYSDRYKAPMLTFYDGNNYFSSKINKDYPLSIQGYDNFILKITNRDQEGKIPLLESSGEGSIYDFSRELELKDGQAYFSENTPIINPMAVVTRSVYSPYNLVLSGRSNTKLGNLATVEIKAMDSGDIELPNVRMKSR
jgi:hypothetical protein